MAEPALSTRANSSSQWLASLELELGRRRGGTRLLHCAHKGPLYVQKPFYPEGDELAHVYVLHPPGGIVSGDSLEISVTVGPGAGALLTTPGAARAYRARLDGPGQRQTTRLQVDSGASLEWFPLETIVYDGAEVESNTRVELAADASCALWEITCLGRPASGELFGRGAFRQGYRVYRDSRPVFVDRFCVERENLAAMSGRAGLQGEPVTGLFLMGPFTAAGDADILDALRDSVSASSMRACAGISAVGDFYLGRYLGESAEQAREVFTNWWRILRPGLLDRPANEPRIWLT